jgi:tetratricopeptide (TPR) repeat protein
MPQKTTPSFPVPRSAPRAWKSARFLAAALLFLSACSSTPQEKEALHMKRGKAAVDKKDYKTAVVEYKVASQNMPKDAEPVYQLGMTYLNGGAAKQAVEAFAKAVSLNPKHEGAQFEMALVKVGSNKPEIVQEAKQVLTAYLATHPDNLDAMGSLALAEAKLDNKAEALKLLEAAAEKTPDDMHAASMVVALYAAMGDVNAAKDVAHELAERQPNSPAAATLRAQVSLATRDTADADAQISRALALRRDFRPALELRLRRELMDRNSASAEETTQELAKLPEKRTWSAYGRILFAEKKIDQAMAEFNRVLKEHNDNAEIRDEYSALLTGAGRRKEAEAVIAGTLVKNPKDRSALLQRATLEIDKGDLDAATKDVKTLQGMKASSPQLSYQQARIFGARGESVQQGDTLADLLKTNPRFLAARLDLARVMLASGKARNSVTLLEQASAPEKRTAEYVFYHNMALMAAGDWDEASKNVAAALAALRSPGFLYQDALVKTHNKDLPGARKSLEAAFQMEPGNALTLSLLGNIMRQQGEGPKFLAMVKEAAAKHPDSAILENVLGRQLAGRGDAAGAKAAFEAAKADGDAANAEIELAALDIRAGAIDKARQRLLDLTKTHDNARARMLLAEIETRKGASADVVISHYLKALELEPANATAMNNLADILASRKSKYDDALFWAQKALATSPNSPVVEDTIGWIYYREGKYDAALPYLEKSAKEMDRPVAHYHLAGALAKSGDPVRGRKEFETALKEDPKSDARGAVGSLFGETAKK